MLSFFTALMLFVRRAHARVVHIYRSILSAMTGNINSLRRLQSCQRPAHAPAPLQSPFLSFFKGLTSLVRPDHAGSLRVVFYYPPTHAIAFVRDVWSGLASETVGTGRALVVPDAVAKHHHLVHNAAKSIFRDKQFGFSDQTLVLTNHDSPP